MNLRKPMEATIKTLQMLCAGVSILIVLFITLFIIVEGIPLFFVSQGDYPPPGVGEFLFGSEWYPTDTPPLYGILPFIAGSLLVTFGAMVIAIPIGVSGGLFISELAPRKARRILRDTVEILAGIPSVVYGFFGIMVIGFFLDYFEDPLFNYNAFSAMVILAIMTLPTIINITDVSIRSVSRDMYAGSLSLGSTKWQAISRILIPSAKNGIITGVILGVGRAVGETMAVLMVAGNQPTLPTEGLKSRVRTLTMAVVNDMGYAGGDHRVALFATAIVLFLFILLLNLVIQFITRKSKLQS